ncbi:MAG: hypothetical protein SFY92_08455 [Verrucomicrobiae bacterium]|nr:hypothetical protein [Verrucomicrobiae bacterium]
MQKSIYYDFDGACRNVADHLGIPRQEVLEWGPRLRFCCGAGVMDRFTKRIADRRAAFTLFGSGDFHHLTSLWQGVVTEPYVLVSFDNHPDWDIRPPRWACGGWINRALENPLLTRAHIWGCGNFELVSPARFFANRRALQQGRLVVHPWRERLPTSYHGRYPTVSREDWRAAFDAFCSGLEGRDVYVTLDLDCLVAGESVTNWEQGLFELRDLEDALGLLRERTRIVGGDLCGAYSPPVYDGVFRRLASHWDHPSVVPGGDTAEVNARAVARLWPALCGA